MNHEKKLQNEIVITGASLVTCMGLDRNSTFAGICELRDALGPLTELEQAPQPDKGGGQAPALPLDFAPNLPREARYLRYVIQSAMKDANVEAEKTYSPSRCGLVLGTTLHGMRAAGKFFRSHDTHDLENFLAPTLIQLAAGDLGLEGYAATTCSACSSGLGSIAIALTLLRAGELDLVIAGGYDVISEYTYAGFNSLRLITDELPRPFGRDRRGLKLGEGYGVVVLERSSDAKSRGVKMLARVLGAGESADAHHLTQPHPTGDGAIRAMNDALQNAQLQAADINMICAHATGTPDNDGAEFQALHSIFGDHLSEIPLTALKSQLGHTLGAAGTVELILTMMAMQQGIIPPTRNVTSQNLEFTGLSIASAPRHAKLQATLNLSLGFGGANTCVILGNPQQSASQKHIADATFQSPISPGSEIQNTREVCVTGVGVVVPGGVGNAAFLAMFDDQIKNPTTQDTGEIPDDALLALVSSRRVRRMSQYVKLTLAATTLACKDAGMEFPSADSASLSAVLGTSHGSVQFSSDFYRLIVEQGFDAANPMLFAEGVPNAGAAQLSLMLGVKGSCQTILGTRTAGLDALRLAWLRIRHGQWDRAIVCAADEYSPLANSAYAGCGLYALDGNPSSNSGKSSGFSTGAGAVAIVLESRASAASRSVAPRGLVDVCSSAMFSPTSTHKAVGIGNQLYEQIGKPNHILCSMNNTWIDQLESASLRHAASMQPVTVSSLHGHLAESFSATPLAGLALLFLSGRLPRFMMDKNKLSGPLRASEGNQQSQNFGVFCTDYTGLLAAARITLLPQRMGVC